LTRVATPKLAGYTGVAALSLFFGLALRLPELVVVAAPLVALVTVALLLARRPEFDVRVALDRDRVLEDEEVELTVEVRASGPAEIYVALSRDLRVVEGENPFAVAGDEERTLRVRPVRWGAFVPGLVHVRAYDPFRVLRYEQRIDRRVPLKVFPRQETLRALARPHETQVFSGNQVAWTKGDGIEFADLRTFAPGDLVRRINWRASARRRELWVNEYHPERNADVVIYVDAFAEASRGDASTLDDTVRAAAALSAQYLREKDRVGLVSFGGTLNWLTPTTGLAQLYRIIDALLDSHIVLSYAWRNLNVIPRGTLPSHALVIALTPLLDERATGALLNLRARGFDLAVVEISPLRYVTPGPSASERVAHRLWELRREAERARFERAGIPVAVWREDGSLGAAVEEVRAFRRFARSGR
jgi:uncharacterized protein (DUF58 family)